MPEDKIAELKANLEKAGKKFVEDLKDRKFDVKAWNVGIGKDGDATTLKFSVEVNISSRKK